tara:strand:+ start:17 stop:217 length:201 start_codon:yes stop_codon:yes gene_type:complete
MFYIYLYQSTQETQQVWQRETLEEIMKLWDCEKASDDYSDIDKELVLYKDDEVLDDYQITDEQRLG